MPFAAKRLAGPLLFGVLLFPALGFDRANAQTENRLSVRDLRLLQDTFASLADKVRPSVVAIRTYTGSDGHGDRGFLRALSQGAGVIFRTNGFILTNYHVIEGATHLTVILHDGSEHDAAIIQTDARSDLAVIKIKAEKLQRADFGDVGDVRVGHWTFAVGNPFGLANFTGRASFTVGNVSSFGRNLSDVLDGTDTRYYGNLIETSAAINPGNSGGPLFNIDGKVIGIVTAIETRSGVTEGVGFAVPISRRTRAILATLERGNEVKYGYLGVRIDKRPPNHEFVVRGETVHGARMGEVLDGPAADAGLKTGDIIIEFDGAPVHDYDHLVRLVGATPVGQSVTARYVRRGRQKSADIQLAERPTAQVAVELANGKRLRTINWRGAVLVEMSRNFARDLNIDRQNMGLFVADVLPASDAALHGLDSEQVVVAVNGKPVRTFDDFRKVARRATGELRLRTNDSKTFRFIMPDDTLRIVSP